MANKSPKGRVHFPNVFEKSDFSGKYDLVMEFAPEDFDESDKKAWDVMLKSANEACKAKHGEGFKDNKKLKSPFTKGDPDEKYFNDPDHYYVKFGSYTRPSVVGPDVKNLDEEDFYSGCYARVSYNPNGYDVSGSKGVNFYLNNVQKVKDGDRLGGQKTTAEEDFEAVEVDEAADLFS